MPSPTANQQDNTEQRNFAQDLSDMLEKFSPLDDEAADKLNREFRAAIAKRTSGISPMEVVNAYVDWLGHLALSPGKQLQLVQSLASKVLKAGMYGSAAAKGIDSEAPSKIKDRSFSGESWQQFPFNVFSQSFLLGKELLKEATSNVTGLTPEHEETVNFLHELLVGAISPANFPFSNPEIMEKTREENGENLKRGMDKLLKDIERKNNGEDPVPDGIENYEVGKHVAITPGKVIYQNRLMELIQYDASTPEVGAEPVLFVPPWIMKYYILDLSPKNSLIKYLVDQGKTVFMISWKNPDEGDRDMGMDDYMNLGFMEAVKAVKAVVPKSKINAVGYCIGGTLLSIGAAALAQEGDNCLNSISLFTAQTDFTEPGEIKRFLSDSHLSFLESLMWKKGYLEASNMGNAFRALRPSDLIWGPAAERYFHGEEGFMNDLMAWNSDGTRMPYRMHSEYLRRLYLENQLAEGVYKANGETISLADITCPMFVVGTAADHVAPWKSVYKIHRLTNNELTFLLTSSGHNAGIISGPVHPRRKHQIHTRKQGDQYIDCDTWQATIEVQDGSWWPVWDAWLDEQMSKKRKPPRTGNASKGYEATQDAPGDYIRIR